MPQCVACNMFRQGEQFMFGSRLVSEYGQDAVDELIRDSKKTVKMSKGDLLELIDFYKKKLKELLE